MDTQPSLTHAKLEQAAALVAQADVDLWLTFDRESAEGGDPILPLILTGGVTWQSALMVSRTGRRVAVVGDFDAAPFEASGEWDEVRPYTQSIRAVLLAALDALVGAEVAAPRIAVNFSTSDAKADGLSHGMFLALTEHLRGTRFEGSLVSAEEILSGLRGCKVPEEIMRLETAIAETERIFAEVSDFAAPGVSEREVYQFIQSRMDGRGLGYGWDRAGNPIVNSGPDSMIGHGIPSAEICIAPGHIFHIDLGVIWADYSSDIQRSWYVPAPTEEGVPADVQRACEAVMGAISAGAAVLRPGIAGWRVDAAGRECIQAQGYPEYMHALGHQVGRMAHDGGALLGPRWERYGRTPHLPVKEDQVFTLELGVVVAGRGYLGIEEMVRVTSDGCAFLTNRQSEMLLLP